jgi:hypothetical protein
MVQLLHLIEEESARDSMVAIPMYFWEELDLGENLW